jgi:hypothetical protein
MIKKKLKKWYSTEEKERSDINLLRDRLSDAAAQLHRATLNNRGNWVIVGPETAGILNNLYPTMTTTAAVNYTNTWCGTTFLNYMVTSTATTINVPIYSATTTIF